MKRLKVTFYSESPYGDYKVGDIGYVDGYVRGGNDVPCAVVVLKDSGRFVLAELTSFKLNRVNNSDDIEYE